MFKKLLSNIIQILVRQSSDWWVDPLALLATLPVEDSVPDFVGVIWCHVGEPLMWMVVNRNLYNKTKKVVKQ